MREKLALVGVFSLTLMITTISIVRFVLSSPDRVVAGPSWVGAWSVIEQSVALIVASCASFRSLLVQKTRSSKGSSDQNRYNFMNSFVARRKTTAPNKSSFYHLPSNDEEPPDVELNSRVEPKASQKNDTVIAGPFKSSTLGFN